MIPTATSHGMTASKPSKFLVHFVGDVHQPFHAIGEAAGGNGIAVTEFGSPTLT